MVLEIPGSCVFSKTDQEYLLSPTFLDQQVEGEEREERKVLGGEPVPVTVLPHSHGVLFGLHFEHSTTYCVDESLYPGPSSEISVLQPIGSEKLFQKAFKV